ncbi:hypothetical protein KBI23_00475 [bacterium]|nr:hypothetical protein [bacterium]MBP9809088.1 hypothetical protein [bacterium]
MKTLKPYWLTAFSIFALLLVRVFLLPSNIINPDCSMFLRAGQLVLAGARPYIDFVELNPPLIFYINVIPSLFAKLSGLSPETSLYLFTLLLFSLSLLLSWKLLHDCSESSAIYFGPIIVAFCLGNLICYEWVQFGQRQQLLANALLPFFICRYLRWHGSKVNAAIASLSGLLCGAMTGLLPQYAAIVVGLELFYVWRQGKMRPLIAPETLSFIISILAYGLFVLGQESIRLEFFGRWMPMVSEGYALYNWPWPMQITQLICSGILPVIAIALLLLLNTKAIKQEQKELLATIGVFCLGSVVALLLQGKCILNQTIPLMYGSLMLACSVSLRSKLGASSFKRTVLTSLVALLAFLLPVYALPGVISQNALWQNMTAKLATVIDKESSPSDRVSVISLSLPDSYPALADAHRASGNRYFFVFPMLMSDYLAKKHAGTALEGKWQEQSKKFIADLEADLHNNNPRIVLIQESTIPMADISVRQYLEPTSFWQTLSKNYEYGYQLKAGPSELSLWKRRLAPAP